MNTAETEGVRFREKGWHLSWKVSWQKDSHDWKCLRKTQNENARATEMGQRVRLNHGEERYEMGQDEEAQTGGNMKVRHGRTRGSSHGI